LIGGFCIITKPARSKCFTSLGDDLGHNLICVLDALAAVEAKRERQGVG